VALFSSYKNSDNKRVLKIYSKIFAENFGVNQKEVIFAPQFWEASQGKCSQSKASNRNGIPNFPGV
jgi:hypothetical protein